jgi:hypothetical protein
MVAAKIRNGTTEIKEIDVFLSKKGEEEKWTLILLGVAQSQSIKSDISSTMFLRILFGCIFSLQVFVLFSVCVV